MNRCIIIININYANMTHSLPADNHNLHVTGLLANSHPDVNGEYSTAAVEDGRQRGHER